MKLKALQEAFYEGVFNPKKQNIDKVCAEINPSSSLSSRDLLSIYRGSILGGMTSALAQIYPVCNKLVGSDYFDHMVAGYLQKYPSGSPDLGNYGEHLSHYITSFPVAKELVYLADVALLEWYWHRVLNNGGSPEPTIRAISELAHINMTQQANLKFCLIPSLQLLTSPYPVDKIWITNQTDFQGDTTVNLDDGAANLAIWRDNDLNMHVDPLSNHAFLFLEAIKNTCSFGNIAEMDFASSLEQLLPHYIQTGIITGFTISS
ncbi:MAG: DNA-binding domain-containing protein [Gammaproteobacteria bacterium]|nr:DNA-binding domain-containing protein [Gammaproteobacteria bacterium]